MSADLFLDTNVLVYAFDQTAPEKREQARQILRSKDWCISWQIVQEFSSVALHRFKEPLDIGFLEDILEHLLWPHNEVMPTPALYRQALGIHQQAQYRFYDALIVAAAIESGASRLYSEDLQSGRRFGDLRIVNPFA